jgi:hypothetical protein
MGDWGLDLEEFRVDSEADSRLQLGRLGRAIIVKHLPRAVGVPSWVPVRRSLEVVSIVERLGGSTRREYRSRLVQMKRTKKKKKTPSWSGKVSATRMPWCRYTCDLCSLLSLAMIYFGFGPMLSEFLS